MLKKKDGTFKPLTTNGSDSMNLAIDANTIGYIHTHLDPYVTGKIDEDGNSILNQPIKMLSPSDVKSFILLLINANKNNIPLSDVYGTMVSSSGTYSLRYEGLYSDINLGLNFDGLGKKYIKEINKNNEEIGFLKFLRDNIGINGISLYKIKSDGTSEKKALETNNKLVTTPCQ